MEAASRETLRVVVGRPVPGRALLARAKERAIEAALFACGLLSVLTTVGIIGVLLWEASSFFAEVSVLAVLADLEWTPLFAEKHYGLAPLLSGTLLTSGIAIVVALPLGLLAAIFLSEIAPAGVRRVIKPSLEVLAGVPTIVYGYFALVVLTPMLQRVIPGLAGFNALSPGIVMGVMITPMIASLSEDALYAVPNALREGAYAVGATRLSAIFRVVLPTAGSGVAASVVLALSRAIGETMIVTVAAGQQPRLTADPRVPIETMTAYIAQVSMGDTPSGTLEYQTIFVVGAALFFVTFVMNVFGQRLARRARGV